MRIVILGSGGYGHTVEDVAVQLGYDCIFLDDSIVDHQLSSYTSFISDDTEFIPAFGTRHTHSSICVHIYKFVNEMTSVLELQHSPKMLCRYVK